MPSPFSERESNLIELIRSNESSLRSYTKWTKDAAEEVETARKVLETKLESYKDNASRLVKIEKTLVVLRKELREELAGAQVIPLPESNGECLLKEDCLDSLESRTHDEKSNANTSCSST